jgi:hypothetical protein
MGSRGQLQKCQLGQAPSGIPRSTKRIKKESAPWMALSVCDIINELRRCYVLDVGGPYGHKCKLGQAQSNLWQSRRCLRKWTCFKCSSSITIYLLDWTLLRMDMVAKEGKENPLAPSQAVKRMAKRIGECASGDKFDAQSAIS